MPPLKKLARKAAVALADTRPGRRLLLRESGGILPVFMLHRFRTSDGLVSGHDPMLIQAALGYLRSRGFRALTIDQVVDGLAAGNLPDRAVAFTMDDGYQDQGRVGAETFIAHDCPCTIFLVTDLIDGRYWPMESRIRYLFTRADDEFQVDFASGTAIVSPKDGSRKAEIRRRLVYELKGLPLDRAMAHVEALASRLSIDLPEQPPAEFAPMSWDDVRRLERRGISFGAHTARHVTLSAESDEVAWGELERSTAALQANVRHPSTVFCYPTGRFEDYGPRDIGFLRKLGYQAAISSEPGYCVLGKDPDARFNILRYGFPDSLEEFKDIVLQLPRLREKWRSRA